LHKQFDFIPTFKIIIFDKEQRPVAVIEENSVRENVDIEITDNSIEFLVKHSRLQLSKGIYSINLLVAKGRIKAPILRMNDILRFQVVHEDEIWPPFLLSSTFENID